MKRLFVVAGAVVLAGSLAVGLNEGPASAQSRPDQQYGYAQRQQPDAATLGWVLDKEKAGGASTIRVDVRWFQLEATKGVFAWGPTDAVVKQAAYRHVRVLFVLSTTPSWASGKAAPTPNWHLYPPTAANTPYYGRAAQQLAVRYGTNGKFWPANPSVPKTVPSGIEVGNEPNLTAYWPSGPNPKGYAAMVRAAWSAKRVDPAMKIVIGSLARHGAYNDTKCHNVNDGGHDSGGYNPVNFLQGMYAAGIRGYFDAVSIHPYMVSRQGITATQMLAANNCSVWSQIATTKVSLRSLMVKYGDAAKKIWITEAGAPTCVSGATYKCVSQAEQANLATKMVALWKSYSWAGNFYWYEIRDVYRASPDPRYDGEQHFGVIDVRRGAKPAYKAYLAAIQR